MDRELVSSTNIRSVGYDADTRTLELEFQSGGIYQYDGVPISIYRGLLTASSVGSYFLQNVKGQYPFLRVR